MELRQMQYFIAIAEHENMTKAAEELHVSQPALSTAVKNLEKELGVPLFDRAGKRLTLNDNGRFFATRSKELISALEETCETVVDRNHTRNHTVNCSLRIPVGNAGKLIKDFYLEHPDIHVNMGYPSSASFHSKTIDIALFGTSIELEDDDVIKLGTEDYVIALPADHPLAAEKEVALSQLRGDSFIFTEPSDYYLTAMGMCHEAGFEPDVRYEMQIFSEALSLVESGLGCCIAASFSWLANYSQNVIVKKPIDVHRKRHLYARLPDGITPSAATWDFVDFLQDYSNKIARHTL